MGYPVPEETFVSAFVIANSGREDLGEEQLTQLAHDEYKLGRTVDTQTLLLGGGVLGTRGARAMDYLDKLDQQRSQTHTLPDIPLSDNSATAAKPAPLIRRIGGTVSPPTWLHRVEPNLSEEAIQAGVHGSVLVNALIDQRGHATNIRVVRGLGMGLDERAVDSVRQSTFIPALDGGTPVPVELNIDVTFKDEPQ
jgi:TonB family protein